MFDRFLRFVPILYLVWAIPFGLAVAWLTPPWQVPDEPQHFMRANQITHGEWIGRRLTGANGGVGGTIDAALAPAFTPFADIPFHAETKDSIDRENQARSVGWTDNTVDADFANTAVYPPVFYLPSEISFWAGKAAHIGVIQTLLASRALSLVASALLTALGLWFSRRTRLALASTAILPMTVSLMASASQDGLMLASTALAVGLIDRVTSEKRACRVWELAAITIALALVGMARPPYLFLLGLIPLTACSDRRARIAALAGLAGILVWAALVSSIAPVIPPANPHAQLDFLLHHPLQVVPIALATIRIYLDPESFIGVLGWLDTLLPHWYIRLAKWGVCLAFAATLAGPARKVSWATIALVALCVAALFAIEYLTYTAPGSPYISGLQGRYFIPLAMTFALALPGWPWIGRWIAPCAAALLAGLMLVTPPVVAHSLVTRYYLGGQYLKAAFDIATDSNSPYPLSAGQEIDIGAQARPSDFPVVTGVSILIGTYAGQSNGHLHITLCEAQTCGRGSADLTQAPDNQPLAVMLDHPVPLESGKDYTLRIEKPDGDRPVALWVYPGRDPRPIALTGASVPVQAGYLPNVRFIYAPDRTQ